MDIFMNRCFHVGCARVCPGGLETWLGLEIIKGQRLGTMKNIWREINDYWPENIFSYNVQGIQKCTGNFGGLRGAPAFTFDV